MEKKIEIRIGANGERITIVDGLIVGIRHDIPSSQGQLVRIAGLRV